MCSLTHGALIATLPVFADATVADCALSVSAGTDAWSVTPVRCGVRLGSAYPSARWTVRPLGSGLG